MSTKRVTKIIVDQKACIGAASCVILAAKAFTLNDDGVVEVLSTALECSDEELIAAVSSCPTGAIKLLDENNNTVA